MRPIFAMIVPLENAYPDQGLPAPGGGGSPSHPIYNPPYPSTGPGFPTHPIAPGGPPPGIWGGAPSYPDQSLPWGPGRPDQSLPWAPGRPSHPIAPGGERPDQSLPWGPGRPDQGLPGVPGSPSHPIVIPPRVDNTLPPGPDQSLPGGGGGTPTQPIYLPVYPAHPIAPGGQPGVPEHPIYIPIYPAHPIAGAPGRPAHPIAPGGEGGQGEGGAAPLPGQDPSLGGWVYAYVPGYGWMWIPIADTSTTPGLRPDQGLPEGAEPKGR